MFKRLPDSQLGLLLLASLVVLAVFGIINWVIPKPTNVYFLEPVDGTTVSTTFTVKMVAEGVKVEAAGTVHAGAGHFHILINEDFVPAGQIVPADDTHRHFGNGATETELTLEPGTYTLRLQFADGIHTSLGGEAYHDEITITVAADS